MTTEPAESPKSPEPSETGADPIVRKLWTIGIVVLVLTALLDVELFFHAEDDHAHAHYVVDGWPGFFSIYGFGSCVILVVFSKVLGFMLKQREDYYDE